MIDVDSKLPSPTRLQSSTAKVWTRRIFYLCAFIILLLVLSLFSKGSTDSIYDMNNYNFMTPSKVNQGFEMIDSDIESPDVLDSKRIEEKEHKRGTDVIMDKLGNETVRAELGRATWRLVCIQNKIHE